MKPSLHNPFDRSLPRRIRVGVGANLLSATMLIGIAAFWAASPEQAAAGAFSIAPDTEAARAFAQLTAIFKAVGDVLPPVFVFGALVYRQWHLAGLFNAFTLLAVPLVDMAVWGAFSGPSHVWMHVPFAVPILIGAVCLIGQGEA